MQNRKLQAVPVNAEWLGPPGSVFAVGPQARSEVGAVTVSQMGHDPGSVPAQRVRDGQPVFADVDGVRAPADPEGSHLESEAR